MATSSKLFTRPRLWGFWPALLVHLACSSPPSPAPPESTAEDSTEPARQLFEESAQSSGLHFVHQNGLDGSYRYPEMMGAGLALFDYDRDGDLDLYLTQGHRLPSDGSPPGGRLFRNDLEQGELHFTDVTEESGLKAHGYGMGATVFDVDRDGWPDLYLTNLGPNQLWRNLGGEAEGGGVVTFQDITESSATGIDGWSVPAAVLDVDRDGWLDLYIGQYVAYDVASEPTCQDEVGARNYCGPLSFRALPDRLLRNGGPGRPFEDVSEKAGIESEFGRTLGAIATDLDGDGWDDVYVGNDGTPNQLWIHRGSKEGPGPWFENRAVLAGAAVSGQGLPEASMGIASADFDDDGDEDLLVTHLRKETNTLYANDGRGHFLDRSNPSGLGPPSLPKTAFGVGWFDIENDGDLDVFVANGAVKVIKSLALAGDPFPLHQPNQLFENRGDGTYVDISDDLGSALAHSEVSRGAAFGDLDNDGDTDVVLLNNGGLVRLLRNMTGQDRSWLGLRLLEAHGGGPSLGALATLRRKNGTMATRRASTAGSYASSNDPRPLFGLGDDLEPQMVQVRWPDGRGELFHDLTVRTWHDLVQGQGQPSEDSP